MSIGGRVEEEKVTLLMVDDHPIVAEAVTNMVARDPSFEVHSAGSGREALALYNRLKPDIVLCDISLDADMSGIELTQRLTQTDPGGAAVIMFTSHADDFSITSAIDAGAVGYITKGTPPDALLGYLKAAARGEQVYDATVAQSVVGVLRRGTVPSTPLLLPREMEVLQLLCDGAVSNEEIAERLFISRHTVKTHLDRIYAKLGVRSKTAAVVHAYKTGLVKGRNDKGLS